jgi:hypothetical protein
VPGSFFRRIATLGACEWLFDDLLDSSPSVGQPTAHSAFPMFAANTRAAFIRGQIRHYK